LNGGPKGLVIGSLLFLIYVNELLKIVSSSIKLFVDDTKIRNKEDIEVFQHDLVTVESWSEKWLLSFHIDKCRVMNLGLGDNVQYLVTVKISSANIDCFKSD